MPIYEYKCDKCGQITEIMQKFSDKPLSRCPECRGKVSKLISNCGFQLKGTGWYVSDYRKRDAGKDKDKETEAKKSEAPKSDNAKSKSEEKKT